jgi:hypothetical protein
MKIFHEKNYLVKLKLSIIATQAKLEPPISTVLGQWGVNTMAFCEEFNKLTESYDDELLLPVIIKVFKDKTIEIYLEKLTFSYIFNLYDKSNDILTIFKVFIILNNIKNISLSSFFGTLKSYKIDEIRND